MVLDDIHASFSPQKAQVGLCKLYKTLNDTMNSWSQAFMNQKNVIDEHLTQFFHYYALQGEQISQFYGRIQSTLEEYLKTTMALQSRKERLFSSKDIANMELANPKMNPDQIEGFFKDKEAAFKQMLPKETAYVSDLGQMFAYLIQQFRFEIGKAEDIGYEDMRVYLRQMSQAMQQAF